MTSAPAEAPPSLDILLDSSKDTAKQLRYETPSLRGIIWWAPRDFTKLIWAKANIIDEESYIRIKPKM